MFDLLTRLGTVNFTLRSDVKVHPVYRVLDSDLGSPTYKLRHGNLSRTTLLHVGGVFLNQDYVLNPFSKLNCEHFQLRYLKCFLIYLLAYGF